MITSWPEVVFFGSCTSSGRTLTPHRCEDGFKTGRMFEGKIIEQHEQPSALREILVNLLKFRFGKRPSRPGDDEQVAIVRHGGVVAEQVQRLGRDVIFRQHRAEFLVIHFAGIGQRRLAVALQKIGLERLGVFHREQHRGEQSFRR